jgi:hypothetical protein
MCCLPMFPDLQSCWYVSVLQGVRGAWHVEAQVARLCWRARAYVGVPSDRLSKKGCRMSQPHLPLHHSLRMKFHFHFILLRSRAACHACRSRRSG